MNYPYNRHIIYISLCKWTCQTCLSGERLKAPWAFYFESIAKKLLKNDVKTVQDNFKITDTLLW